MNLQDNAVWKQYRDQVRHPAAVLKPADLERARANLARHAWARRVLEGMQASVAATLAEGAEHIERMIPATTPGGVHFTNCPACEGNTIHGAYDWDPRAPEQLVCTTCRTVYPNDRYPEDLAFRAERHGNGQVITYHGGYAFDFRGFALRSSWTAQIRARKVAYMASQAQALATVYALTGERRCAEKARAILLRFAAVYPHYLVHSSYGEWIDLPPRLVAERINDLPEDEWTIPPNRPDRKLHSGYWNSGRATGSGMEGGFIRSLATAYDLVYGILTEEERLKIERDLLIEGTVLLLADPALNNKSVSNLSAAGLVGMVVGDPDLVRAGAKGFWHFVHEWFLPDGTTSESPAYGLMTLNGMWSFGEALHGYSDPPGYRGADRIDACDVYADGKYRAVFRALYDTLLPNLCYPASADSYVPTSLGTQYAELMAVRYKLPEYRALLREKLGGPVAETGGEYALFHRDPDFAIAPEDRILFGDTFFPALRMAYLRSGAEARGGVAILNASHWGGHHHRDSLNLTLFEHGHELLTDLGYLWDRPDKEMTVRTPAHNMVVVDEAEQRTTERGGSLHYFDVTPHVKVAECSSSAYEQAPLYRRLCVRVDHGAGGAYLLDLFRVAGGKTHDYLFHGPLPDFKHAGLALSPAEGPTPYGLHGVRRGAATAPWRLQWEVDAEVTFSAWALPVGGEEVLIGQGWGERGWGHFNTPDKKVEVPYVLRRRTGDTLSSTFVTLFEAHRGQPLVTGLALVQTVGDAIAVEVQMAHGADILVAALTSEPRTLPTSRGTLETDGTLTIVASDFLYLAGGTRARCGERRVELPAGRLSGAIRAIVDGDNDSYLIVDGLSEDAVAGVIGRTVLVENGTCTTGYAVRHATSVAGETRVYTKRGGTGYDVSDGASWTIVLSGYGVATSSTQAAGST